MGPSYQTPFRAMLWLSPWFAGVFLTGAWVWLEHERRGGESFLKAVSESRRRLSTRESGAGVSRLGITLVSPSGRTIVDPGVDEGRAAPFWFQWKTDRAVSGVTFRFEMALNGEFRPILVSLPATENRLSSSRLALKTGTFHWRVSAFDKDGVELGRSAVATFDYAIKTAPRAPSGFRVRVEGSSP